MNEIGFGRLALPLALCSLLLANVSARANSSVTFVSQNGDDSQDCSPGQPCRTFSRAISQTKLHGTIVAMPGNYSYFALTRPVNIVSSIPGAAVVLPGQGKTGAIIVLPANEAVLFDGLRFDGSGFTADTGIYIDSADSTVNVINCSFSGFTGTGISIVNALAVSVKKSLFSHSVTGVTVNSSATTPTIAIYDTSFVDNNVSFFLKTGPANVTINETTLAQSYHGGLVVQAGSVFVKNSTITGDGTAGISVGGGGVLLSQSTITQNKVGILLNGGTATTFGNNNIKSNQNDVSGGNLISAAQN